MLMSMIRDVKIFVSTYNKGTTRNLTNDSWNCNFFEIIKIITCVNFKLKCKDTSGAYGNAYSECGSTLWHKLDSL